MKNTADCGLNPEQLERLIAALNKDVEAGRYDGGVVLVARHGIIGLEQAIGFADRENNRPCRLDDVFCIMSITKAFTDVILFSQIEQGDISLTTRVADVIPEFKGGLKEQVTIFHLLTHTAGSPQLFFPTYESPVGNHKAAFDVACKIGLMSAPGEKADYSCTWGHTVLGEVIRRVDRGKRALRDIYQDKLFGPLKMKDTAMGKRRKLASRLVPPVACSDDKMLINAVANVNKAISEDSEIPAWGCVSTVHDLFRFAEMLRQGGELDGIRILSPVTIELATKIHTGTKTHDFLYPLFAEHGWPPFPANLGLDLIVRGEGIHCPVAMGSLTSPRTFGKFGAGSTGFWVDPDRDVTFIFLSVGLLDEYYNFVRFQRLSDMAMAAVI